MCVYFDCLIEDKVSKSLCWLQFNLQMLALLPATSKVCQFVKPKSAMLNNTKLNNTNYGCLDTPNLTLLYSH